MRARYSMVGVPLAVALLGACGGGGAAVRVHGTTPGGGAASRIIPVARREFNEAAHEWQQAIQAGWTESRCESVAEAFQGAAEQNPGGRFAEAWFNAGLALGQCSQMTDRARAMYERALEANPNYAPARVQLGLLAHRAGNVGAAFSAFEQAIRGDAQSVEAYVNLAILQRQRAQGDDLREAESNLRRALAVDAQYVPAFNQLALLNLDEAERNPQKLKLASVVCKQATTIDPDYAPVYNTWGLIRVREGNIVGALANFERAARLDPRNFEALMNFGSITLSFRGYEDAQTYFSKAKAINPRSYDARIGLGVALRGRDQIEAAEAEYNAAREIDPSRPDAYFNLGLVYQDYKNGTIPEFERAKAYFADFLSRASGRQALAEVVQQVQQRVQNIDQTIDALRQAATIQQQAAQQQGGSP